MIAVIGPWRIDAYTSIVIAEALMIEAGLVFCVLFLAAFLGFEKGLTDI